MSRRGPQNVRVKNLGGCWRLCCRFSITGTLLCHDLAECQYPGPGLAGGLFCSEWYLIPKAAFTLMPFPLVIEYSVKTRKLTICPSQ